MSLIVIVTHDCHFIQAEKNICYSITIQNEIYDSLIFNEVSHFQNE